MGAAKGGDDEDKEEGGLKPADPLLPILRQLATAPEPSGNSLAPGHRIGRFELLRELGHGGFGVVYEARDRDLGRHVALKVMAGSVGAEVEPGLAPLFKREAETAARL